jgi:hypothetical protein
MTGGQAGAWLDRASAAPAGPRPRVLSTARSVPGAPVSPRTPTIRWISLGTSRLRRRKEWL